MNLIRTDVDFRYNLTGSTETQLNVKSLNSCANDPVENDCSLFTACSKRTFKQGIIDTIDMYLTSVANQRNYSKAFKLITW